MKKEKRLISSLLVLCMTTSMYSSVLAEEEILSPEEIEVLKEQAELNNQSEQVDKTIMEENSNEQNVEEVISNEETNDETEEQEIISNEETSDKTEEQEVISNEEANDKTEEQEVISNEEANDKTEEQEVTSNEEADGKTEEQEVISNEETNDETEEQEVISNEEADNKTEEQEIISNEEIDNKTEEQDIITSDEVNSGEYGSLTWTLENSVLTIEGTGDIINSNDSRAPWNDQSENIKTVIIENGITGIGDWAFSSYTALEEVVIPDSVTNIGNHAFEYCYFLTNINLPKNVTLGEGVFARCTISRITIPDGVTEIKYGTFEQCRSLKEIIIPESITKIDYAFNGCFALKDVYYSGSKEQWDKISISSGNDNLEDATIHYGSTNEFDKVEIATSGTCGDNITWELKDGTLTLTGTGTMDHYTITSFVELPPWYQSFDSIEKVVMSEGITCTGSMAFENCKNLKEVKMSNTITYIASRTFMNCPSLETVTLPNNVVEFGEGAFLGCTSLKQLTIPNSVISIDSGAFHNCENLKDIYYKGSEEDWKAISIDTNNESLKDATIHYNSSTSADSNKCGTNVTWTLESGILTIDGTGDMYDYNVVTPWFKHCKEITTVVFKEGVTNIGECAFYGCSNLTFVTVPNTIKNIGIYAFYNCENLKDIDVSNTVQSIGYRAFNNCKSLEYINIPQGITTIDHDTFSGCKSLNNITIPNSVTSIGDSAFSGCESLTEITLPESITNIGDFAFNSCDNLTKINIPKKVTKIKRGAFSGCKSLPEIKIPNTVTSIDDMAFSSCDSLTEIILSNSVTNMGGYAFSSCDNLKSVVLPNKIAKIRWYTFSDCANLEKITIPVSVTEIEPQAFHDCNNLKDVYYEGNEEQWKNISIGSWNGTLSLGTATIHYNSIIPDTPDKPDTPNVPDKPDTPNKPSVPSKPDTPPSEPDTPDTPSESFIITFSANGGKIDGETISIAETDKAGKLTSLPTPVRSNYTFDGWFTDKRRGEEITTNTVFTQDTTVYAHWTSKGSSSSSGGGGGSSSNSHRGSSGGSSSKTSTSNQKAKIFGNMPGGAIIANNDGTVTITPEEGYQIAAVSVNGQSREIPQDGTLTNLTSSDTVNVRFEKVGVESSEQTNPNESVAAQPQNSSVEQFTDISKNAWYYESVKYALDQNLFSGIGNGMFAPNDTMTRAMLMTVLARMNGQEVTGGSTWYEKSMNWAKANNISDGTNPTGDITREQLAAMLFRYANSPATSGNLTGFSDTDKVSNYAKTALCWAVENNLIYGKDKQMLDPKGKATRAEVAAILMRFCEIMKNR